MNNPSPLPTLVVATQNQHKLGEIRTMLGERFRCCSLKDFAGAPQVVEDAPTFTGNATKKSVELARWLKGQISNFKFQISEAAFVLADDSGLEVDALKGAPGVHSARFAALDTCAPGNSSDADNNAKLLHLLNDLPFSQRTARFRCVLALTRVAFSTCPATSASSAPDGFEAKTELFEGACEGRIGFEPQGQGGFGYDPLFIPEGFQRTFAELGEEVKNRISHRAQALLKLKTALAS